MGSKYIKVDDVMELINTSNRGTCDYFIVDQIEELCKSEKVYDVNKVVKQLEEDKRHTFDGCINKKKAIEIVKGGGVDAKTDF